MKNICKFMNNKVNKKIERYEDDKICSMYWSGLSLQIIIQIERRSESNID